MQNVRFEFWIWHMNDGERYICDCEQWRTWDIICFQPENITIKLYCVVGSHDECAFVHFYCICRSINGNRGAKFVCEDFDRMHCIV